MADDVGFNVQDFVQQWAKQKELTATRQEEENKALVTKQEADQNINKIEQATVLQKRAYVEQIKPLVSEYTTAFKAGETQRQLLNSGSFVDQLQAMQNAIVNPSMYTVEGRDKTRSEIGSQVNILATMQAAQEAAAQAQMESINQGVKVKNAAYNTAQLLELHQTEVMKANQERSAAITQGLQETHTARALILSDMTPDQLNQQKQAAVKTGNVNIAGFDVPASAIDLEINRRANLEYDTQSKDLAIQSQNLKMQQAANKRILGSLTLDEKQALLAGQPVKVKTSAGESIFTPDMFDTGDIKEQVTAAQAQQDRMIKQNTDAIMFPDVPNQMIKPALEKMDSALSKLPKTSPAYVAASLHKQQLIAGMIQLNAGNEALYGKDGKKIPDPTTQTIFRSAQASMGAALDKENEKVDAAIQKQAQLDARGNKEMTDLYTSYYRGDLLDSDAINKVAMDQIVKGGLPPVGLFGPMVGKEAFNTYVELVNKEKTQNGGELPGIDSKVQQDRKQELAQIAIQTAVNKFAQSSTDDFLGKQAELTTDPDPALASNPISTLTDADGNKTFPTAQAWQSFIKNAESKGVENWKNEPDNQWLTPDDVAKLQAGQDVAHDGKQMTVQQYAQSSNYFQAQSLLADLDSRRPGLARQYTDWWNTNGPTYAKKYVDSVLSQSKTGKFQDSVYATMASSQIEGGINEYARAINQAADTFNGDLQKRRTDWVSYNGDPGNTQAMALQLDSSLSDQERSMVYSKAILPIISAAKEKKWDMATTNAAVEAALADPTKGVPGYADDPALKKALTKVLVNRSEVTKVLHSMGDVPWLYGNSAQIPANIQQQMSPDSQGPYGYSGGIIDYLKGQFSSNQGTFNRTVNKEINRKPYDWYREIIGVQDSKNKVRPK